MEEHLKTSDELVVLRSPPVQRRDEATGCRCSAMGLASPLLRPHRVVELELLADARG